MTMTKRQMLLGAALLLLAAVLVWQVQALRREWSPPKPMVHPATLRHVSTAQVVRHSQSPVVVVPHKHQPLSLSPEQQRYLRMADAIQMAKMERELIAAKSALAKARVALEQLSHTKATASHSLRQTAAIKPYQLHYLGYQDGHWHAVLSLGQRYTTVEGPMTLLNHDQVLQLSEAGLLMGHGDARWLVTIDGVQLMAPVSHPVAVVAPKKKPEAHHHALLQLPVPLHSTAHG